ncbi:Rne/Rng family ribonuclease [Fictibacillus sp. KU28468]|uniref:Rne/Rng family ribonuclease n=1 Tax=Fictibacillus sp. KU28468 TaxID=2991053 RepID=UPI00223DB895|nr:Rne/Rng family ribonuclease [Fictibacillus sp. KU28468]UZJ80431.1 Rne/Rng family ribonuclease [Fictibacillus sp. KU28468]
MKKIIINALTPIKRTAVMDFDEAIELQVDDSSDQTVPGSIYKGRVKKVLPGMQAAFVDIGAEKNGFIHRDDLLSYQQTYMAPEDKKGTSISSFVKEGEELIVQVIKEETDSKGARLTGMLAIPGSRLVFLPNASHIGVSKKMSRNEKEKWRLFGHSLVKGEDGVIFRTACTGQSEDDIQAEFDGLVERHRHLAARAEQAAAPALLHDEGDYLNKIIRDHAYEDETEIIIDDGAEFRKLIWLAKPFPLLQKNIVLYSGKENIFSYYGVDAQWEKALRPHVWLKNGGSLRIDYTEAMSVIDVNTDKFTGKSSRRETVLQTNLQAAEEIAKQLRLRNISGMIVIDFITMNEPEDQQRVEEALKAALALDGTTTVVHGFTRMGVFEMTRKKEKKPLFHVLTETCSVCKGTGRVQSARTVANQAELALREYRHMDDEALWIEATPEVARHLRGIDSEHLQNLESLLSYRIYISESGHDSIPSYAIRHIGPINEIEERMKR